MRLIYGMFLYDLALLGSAGIAVSVLQVATGLGVSIEEMQAVLVAAGAVAVLLVRHSVGRVLRAVEALQLMQTKQTRLASAVGLVWDPESEEYVRKENSGPHVIYQEAEPARLPR